MPPSVELGKVPLKDAIAFLKQKVSVPTKHWDDIKPSLRAKSHSMAGATKMALIEDSLTALAAVAENGGTIADFRKDFDKFVKRHGWSYKGQRGWRTRVIFDTNMRQAAMAGKWQQFQRTREDRPYLQYLTAGDSRVRPDHRQWDGMVVHIDDPWWDTHMPLNGFGCRCTVVALSDRDLARLKLKESKKPQDEMQEKIIPRTGEIVNLPEGVDYGFDANPGKNWNAPEMVLGERLAVFSNIVGSDGLARASRTAAEHYIKRQNAPIAAAYKPWIEGVFNDQRMIRGRATTVGYIDMAVFAYFASNNLAPIDNAAILLTDKQVRHMLRDSKKTRGAALSPDDIRRMPEIIGNPDAILYDKREPALLYVFSPQGEERNGKLVVRIDRGTKRQTPPINEVRTGGLINPRDLPLSRYDRIQESIE